MKKHSKGLLALVFAAALGAPAIAGAATTSVVQLRDRSVHLDLFLLDECTLTSMSIVGSESSEHRGGRRPTPSDVVSVLFFQSNECEQTTVFLSGDAVVPPGSVVVSSNGSAGSIDATFLLCAEPGCTSPSVPVSVSADVAATGTARLDNIHERTRFPDGSRVQSRVKGLVATSTPAGMVTIGASTFSLDAASALIVTNASGTVSLTRP